MITNGELMISVCNFPQDTLLTANIRFLFAKLSTNIYDRVLPGDMHVLACETP